MITLFGCNKNKSIDFEEFEISNYNTYMELFGSTFDNSININVDKFKGKMILNDINSKLIDLWYCIFKNPIDMYYEILSIDLKLRRCDSSSRKNEVIQEIIESKNKLKISALEYVTRNKERNNRHRIYYALPENLDILLLALHSRLDGCRAKLGSKDYKDLMEENNTEDTFIYMEPPSDIKYRFNQEKLMIETLNFKGRVVTQFEDSAYIRELYGSSRFKIRELNDNKILVIKE